MTAAISHLPPILSWGIVVIIVLVLLFAFKTPRRCQGS
jgi:hypothetical protein